MNQNLPTFEIPTIQMRKVHESAVIPQLANPNDAGLDLKTIEAATINPGCRALLRTGLAMAIPGGQVGLIWPRSKLAAKMGVDVLAGVVDSGYRGEVMVSLLNTGNDPVELKPGDKVAQMIIQATYSWLPIEVVDVLPETERGDAGINSSEMRLN